MGNDFALRKITAALVLGVLSCPVLAYGTEGEDPDLPWSIGAGIGLASYGDPIVSPIGMSLLSPLIYRTTPWGVMLVEKQLTHHVSWILDVRASVTYLTSEDDSDTPDGEEASEEPQTSGAVGGATGMRWNFNPGGPVEVSGTVVAAGWWQGVEGIDHNWMTTSQGGIEKVDLKYATNAFSVGLAFGLVLERKLLDNLFLRFESRLLNAYYTQVESSAQTLDADVTTDKDTRLSAGLAFSPAIQLRLEF